MTIGVNTQQKRSIRNKNTNLGGDGRLHNLYAR